MSCQVIFLRQRAVFKALIVRLQEAKVLRQANQFQKAHIQAFTVRLIQVQAGEVRLQNQFQKALTQAITQALIKAFIKADTQAEALTLRLIQALTQAVQKVQVVTQAEAEHQELVYFFQPLKEAQKD